jgi:hypothetical protein
MASEHTNFVKMFNFGQSLFFLNYLYQMSWGIQYIQERVTSKPNAPRSVPGGTYTECTIISTDKHLHSMHRLQYLVTPKFN